MTALPYLLGILLSYLLGSVPFGFLIARAKGVDIRTLGSGNIGATNVLRTLGKGPGILTFVLDFCKGLLATCVLNVVAAALAERAGAPALESQIWLQMLCGASVLLGHSFPVFLGFKGGKGVATGAGLAVGLAPLAALWAVLVWLVVFILGRYVSLASILAALVVAVLGWVLYDVGTPRHVLPAVLTVLSGLVILRHRANLVRLVNGTETRFNFKSKKG